MDVRCACACCGAGLAGGGASGSGGPVLHRELGHGEVPRIPRGEARPDADGRRRDQAIRLAQRDSFGREITPPATGKLTLFAAERRDAAAAEEQPDCPLLLLKRALKRAAPQL